MSDPSGRYAKYDHLRANVPRRRAAYGWIIVLAIVVFAFSIIDILFLDEVSELGVYAIYAVLAIWAIIMYFSLRKAQPKEEPVEEFEAEAVYEPADRQHGVLACPSCKHLFQFGAEHFEQRRNVPFSCPECGHVARLPPAGRQPIESLIPKEPVHERVYHCDSCDESWDIGTFGHAPKMSRFEACPYCGVDDQIRVKDGTEVRSTPMFDADDDEPDVDPRAWPSV
ncbi:MAG: hypothetical protein ACPGQL_08680 [Thermoplasmatota archaeon]